MSAKFWQSRLRSRHVKKLLGIINVPAFALTSGRKSAMGMTSIVDRLDTTAVTITDAFSACFWIKYLSTDEPASPPGLLILNNQNAIANVDTFRITIIDRKLRVIVYTTDIYSGDSTYEFEIDVWTHVGVVYDSGNLKIFINGVLNLDEDIVTAGGGLELANSGDGFYIGYNLEAIPANAGFYLSSLLFWNKGITQAMIRRYMYSFPSAYDDGLKILALLRGSNDPIAEMAVNYVNNTEFNVADAVNWIADDFPHCHVYGASMVIAESIIDTGGESFSLTAPIAKPTNCINFVPCISFEVENCNCPYPQTKRYQFWSICAEDCLATDLLSNCGELLHPTVELYTGQVIPSGAKLEIWSIDGQVNATLEELLELETSILHIVKTIKETTRTEDATITLTQNIAETFPLTFPLAFDQPLTF